MCAHHLYYYTYTRLLYLSTACNHIITLRGNIRVCPQRPLLKGFSKQMFRGLMYQIHDVYTHVYYNGVPSVPSAQWISFDRVQYYNDTFAVTTCALQIQM
jgi:hypothetical protein